VPGIEAGGWYRFTACYRASGITSENRQILPRIDWLTSKGERAGGNEHVDYAARSCAGALVRTLRTSTPRILSRSREPSRGRQRTIPVSIWPYR
jgi:hypothetical protein